MNLKSAITKVNQAGIILVFPITNQTEPASLWSAFYPKTKMRWEWDDEGDNRVADLWHLRTELSSCRGVVYAKWFRGRATLFSRPVFTALLRSLGTVSSEQQPLGRTAAVLLEALSEDSPQSPRTLREVCDLQGKPNEAEFNRSIKELWLRLLIVGFGEFDDGAFPSLAIGASKLLFEELWEEAEAMGDTKAEKIIASKLDAKDPIRIFLNRTKQKLLEMPN